MAITPYRDLSSEDILAAHVSGLQHSVNKIEQVLNMKTATASGHKLVAVNDQDDPSLRYRIYEGTIRGWLEEPEPIIYRNGSVVDPNEYVISPAHGVVVFHQQQASTDEITADFTHIIAESTRIEGVEADISTLQTEFKSLQIGGRNLLRNTGDFKDLTYWSLSKSTNQQGLLEIVDDSVRGKVLHVTKPNHDDRGWWVLLNRYYLYRPEKFTIGKEYTLSLDIKASVAMTVTINFRDRNRRNPVTGDLTQSISTPNTWNRYTFTFKATATGNEPHLYIWLGSSIGELWLDNVKLEEGNRATDWTPAPEDVQSEIDGLGTRVTNLETEVQNLQSPKINCGTFPFYPISGSYLTHFRRDYNPFHPDGSVNVDTHIPSFAVLVYGNTIDAFPFPVTTKTRFKQAAMSLNYAGSDVKVKIGIYKDNGSLRPGDLLFESPTISIPAEGGWGYADISWELEPGFYWIARHDGTTAYWNGLAQQSVINLVSFNAETFLQDLAERPNPHTVYGGYRATNIPFGNMPDPFPASAELFRRAHYCSPWLVVE